VLIVGDSFYDDMHLSEAGARRVAELVVAWILELPATLRPRP
jgi:lysophospholipase L1-like esterase